MNTSYILLRTAAYLCFSCCLSVADDTSTKKSLSDTLESISDSSWGYLVVSSDFEKEPNRQISITVTSAGEIVDARARFVDQRDVSEWCIVYHEGVPLVAQLKRWKKLPIADETSEALAEVRTFLSDEGNFNISDQGAIKQLENVITFAENSLIEQDGASNRDEADGCSQDL